MQSDPEYYLVIKSGLKPRCLAPFSPPQNLLQQHSDTANHIYKPYKERIFIKRKKPEAMESPHIFILFLSEQSHKIIITGVLS